MDNDGNIVIVNGNINVVTYLDAYQIYELLDKWNHQGPPDVAACRQLLLHDRPGESRRTFLFGQTLLHKCLEHYGPRTDLVHVLIESFPQALERPDDNGFLPLHRLLIGTNWGDNILDLVKGFVHRYPKSIMEATSTGALPLHLACKRNDVGKEPQCVEVVRFLVSCFPDAVRYRDEERKYPLDHALDERNTNLDVVRLLIQQYPVLLSFPDDDGRLPLHRTLKWSFGLRYQKVVEILVDGFEGALRLQDKDGYTPLLYACTMNRRLSSIYSLVRKWPEQVMRRHAANVLVFGDPNVFNGEILHSSLSGKAARLDHVEQWLERYPDAVGSKDLQGRLPLHYAVLSTSPDAYGIVRLLLKKGEPAMQRGSAGTLSSNRQPCTASANEEADDNLPPDQLATADKDGRLPLHFAAACPTCSNVVLTLLIDKSPKALIRPDNDGRLPWHYGDLARQDVVFEETTKRFPEIEYNLDLVPDEIRWDILQVVSND